MEGWRQTLGEAALIQSFFSMKCAYFQSPPFHWVAINNCPKSKFLFHEMRLWKAAGAQRLKVKETELAVCLERMRMVWSLSARPAGLINNATIAG